MTIDRTFYAIVGIKASTIEIQGDLIDRIQSEEVGSLLWVDSNAMSGGEEYIGIVLHIQNQYSENNSATEVSDSVFLEAIVKAKLELKAIGYDGEVAMFLLMAIS